MTKNKLSRLKSELSFSNDSMNIDDLKRALSPFDVYVYVDPRFGEDSSNFILSNYPMSTRELNDIDDESFSEEDSFKDDEEFDIDEF